MRAALLVLLVACGTSERNTEPPPPPRVVEATTTAQCASGVELIYVVDDRGELASFDPRKQTFRTVGTLDCNDVTSPFSMAVDRRGTAWVGYQSGKLHQVSVLDGRCSPTSTAPEGAPRTFGMGFVTDGPGAKTEKLYVAGNYQDELGTVDTKALVWKSAGKLPALGKNPELTGTADGRLYGYFPGEGSRGFIQELARTGEPIGQRWNLPEANGNVSAWAFAFWGDAFYVFIHFNDDQTSHNEVHVIQRKTGDSKLLIDNGTRRITGAGVSTCAPVVRTI